MPRHARYSPEVRERAVRMMAEHRDEYRHFGFHRGLIVASRSQLGFPA